MSGAPIPGRLAARVTQLEQQVLQLSHLREMIELAALGDNRDVRLARTAIKPGGSYPTSPANTFWIEFLDSYFTDASGTQTPTHASRGIAEGAHAHNLAGVFVPEGTVVEALWQRGLNSASDGEWWFRLPAAAGDMEWDQVTAAGDATLSLLDVSDLVGGSLDADGDGIVTYASGTGTMTIAADGTYEFHANVETEFSTSVFAGQIAGQVKISFKVVDGSGTNRYTIGHNSHPSGLGVSRYTATGSVILELEATDTVNIEANVIGHTNATAMSGQADLNQWTVKKLA